MKSAAISVATDGSSELSIELQGIAGRRRAVPGLKVFSATLVGLALALALTPPVFAADAPGVRFRTIEEGFAEARASGKPLLLFFTADWCPPCHSLESEVLHSKTFVKDFEKDFVPVKVLDRRREDGKNTPDVDALQERTNVSGFPTLVIMRADGQAAVRSVGYSSRTGVLGFLRQGISRLESAEKKQERLAARP